jgi:methylated-DNA-protein-cysteine methyltransferase-like protein
MRRYFVALVKESNYDQCMVPVSEFTKTVIHQILKIPHGKVATYKQIAELTGKPQASRGVSWILHSCSRKYKLPWHRVLNSQGKISFDITSTNFRLQKKKLEAEGVSFSESGKLDLDKYQWKKKAKSRTSKPSKTADGARTPKMFG